MIPSQLNVDAADILPTQRCVHWDRRMTAMQLGCLELDEEDRTGTFASGKYEYARFFATT